METLSGARKKELRGQAQRLKPQVQVGRQGITPGVLSELERALAKDGLIKVRVEGDRIQVRALAEVIPAQVPCAWIGQVGKTLVFYREPVAS